MDLEQIGTGAGGGLIGAVLAFFGVSKRLDRQEADLTAFKKEVADSISKLAATSEQAVKEIKQAQKDYAEKVVYRDTCNICRQNWTNQIQAVANMQTEIKENIKSALAETNHKFEIVMENLSRRRDDRQG